MTKRFSVPALLLAALVSTTVAAEPPKLRGFLTAQPDSQRMVILIRFFDKDDELVNDILDVKAGAPYDSSSYEFKDASGTSIPVRPLTEDIPNTLVASKVMLAVTNVLDPARQYQLIVKEKALQFVTKGDDGKPLRNERTILKFGKDGQPFDQNIDYLKRAQSVVGKSDVQVLGGSPGGVVTAKIVREKTTVAGSSWANFRFEADADITVSASEKREYFNNVSGEFGLYTPIYLWASDPVKKRYSEISLHARSESDQTFKTTDGLVGAQYAIYPRDPISTWIGRIFVTDNPHLGPLIIAGYDFAHNLGGSPSTNAIASGIDTGGADHRLSALMRWRIPVLSDFEMIALPKLGSKFDMDLLLDLKGVYDINADKFLDQSRISLEFSPSGGPPLKPSVTLTWARGKEGPTWKEVNALLAGLKVSF